MTDFGSRNFVTAKRYPIAKHDPDFGDESGGVKMVCHECAHLWNGSTIDVICPECDGEQVGMAPRVRRTIPSSR